MVNIFSAEEQSKRGGGAVGPGEAIRRYRQERRLTLKEVAAKTGLSISYLSEIEAGRKFPSLSVVYKLSETLHIPLGQLLPASEEEEHPLTLGERIRLAREERGLTLGQLATRCGLSDSYLSQVERGEATPSAQSLRAIAEALDLPLGPFLHDRSLPLGERLRAARESLGISRSELAKQAGISSSMIAQLEEGEAQPSLGTLQRLARVLGISPCYLILEDPSLEEMLSSISPELRSLLFEPQVQSVLRMICDLSEKELKLVLNFIRLLKTSKLED